MNLPEKELSIYNATGSLLNEIEKLNGAVQKNTSYTYDESNNRKTMSIAGGAATAYEYDRNNRLNTETKVTGDITEITYYNYDDNG